MASLALPGRSKAAGTNPSSAICYTKVAANFPKRRSSMTTLISPALPRSRSPQRSDDEPLFEIIDGQRMELSPMSILASRVASNLLAYLGHYRVGNPRGEVLTETLFRLPLPADRN